MSKRPETIGTKELAKMLGLSVKTVQGHLDKGLIPSTRTPGGHRRVERNEVEEFIRQKDAIRQVLTTSIDLDRDPDIDPLIRIIGDRVMGYCARVVAHKDSQRLPQLRMMYRTLRAGGAVVQTTIGFLKELEETKQEELVDAG